MVQCERARRRDEKLRGRMMASFAALSAAAALAVVVMSAGAARAPAAADSVVLLRQAVTEKLESRCDAACKQEKAALVKQQMAALRKEINSDYHSMTHFGDEAGYVPPVKSIKAQVMDGTLLSSSDGPAAPPPFSPKLSIAHVKANAKPGKAFGAANMKKLLKAQEPGAGHRAASSSGSSILPPISSVGDMEKKLLRETPATPTGSSHSLSFLHPDRDAAVHVHAASHAHSHAAGRAKWAKEFNFVKHRSSALHHDSHSAGAVKWAKEFSFVKNHAAKVAARSRIHSRAVRGRRDAEPSVVRHAMQKALSFAP